MQTISLEQFTNSDQCKWVYYTQTELYKMLLKLPKLYPDGPWLVGGTVRRFLIGEEPTTDFDFMFRDQQQFETFCGEMRERGAELHHETVGKNITFMYEGHEIQAICAVYSPTLVQTLEKFDFTICQFGFDGQRFVWGDQSMDHLKQKKLVSLQNDDPIQFFRRAMKYATQGFYMNVEEAAKFLKKLQPADVDASLKRAGEIKFELHTFNPANLTKAFFGKGSYA